MLVYCRELWRFRLLIAHSAISLTRMGGDTKKYVHVTYLAFDMTCVANTNQRINPPYISRFLQIQPCPSVTFGNVPVVYRSRDLQDSDMVL